MELIGFIVGALFIVQGTVWCRTKMIKRWVVPFGKQLRPIKGNWAVFIGVVMIINGLFMFYAGLVEVPKRACHESGGNFKIMARECKYE